MSGTSDAWAEIHLAAAQLARRARDPNEPPCAAAEMLNAAVNAMQAAAWHTDDREQEETT